MAQFDGIIPELARAGYFNKINGIEAGIEDIYVQIGKPNGIAPLGENGLIEPQYLPSYVDDVLEYPDYASLPVVGEQGKIYITVDETKVWRWSGTVYIEIVASPSSTDSVPEGFNNLYYTAERAQSDVVNITGNADTANRLSTARLVQLSGGVTGSGLFNGSSNLTIAATVVDDSHNHSTSTITGLSDVATSGDYSDLLNTPTLGSAASKDVPSTGNATPSQVVLGNDSRLSDARIASDVESWAKAPNKPTYTATEVGAQVQSDDLDSISGLTGTSGVLRKIGENQYELAQDVVVDNDLIQLINAIDGKVESSLLGVVNGVATLDGNGDIPLTQLPTHSHTIADVTNLQTALDGKLGVSATAVAATTLTGLTSTITELNYVDGVTSNVQTQLNSKVNSSKLGVSNGVATLDSNGDIPLSQLPTHSHAISDISNLQTSLDGKLGISATAVAATTLTGLTSTITELNYVDGVTSNVQTQLNGKQPLSAELTGIAGISATSGLIKKTGAGTYSLDSTVYTSVGSVTPLVDSGSTGVVGVSTTAARSDHVHPVATSVLSNSASTTSVSVGISTNGVAGTSTSISAATTSQAGVMTNSQVASLNTAISDISTLQTTVAGKEPSFSVLPVNKGGTGVSSISGVLKGNGTSQLSAATSNDIVALVPDATTSQAGKMTTAQVSSLNELGGLVSLGSGVVKKTLSTAGLDTYSSAVINDLVTSTNVVSNLNADMLDGNHASAFSLSGHTHDIATTSTAGFLSTANVAKLNALTVSRLLQVTTVDAPPVDEVHDLNNFTTNGFFHHKFNLYAINGLNYPTPYAGMLEVTSNDTMVYQWYHTYNNKGVYFRSKYISTWYPWCKVFDSVNTTSTDILALVPDATTLQSGKMTTSQVTSLNELGGLVSLGSGVVKKTLSTSGVATYSTAVISDLATSGTGISIGSNQISLATLTDSGTGSLLKLTRDVHGRVSGTAAVTAADIKGLSGLFDSGGTSYNDSLVGASGSISIDFDKDVLRVHDGVTAGGQFRINHLGSDPVYFGGGTPCNLNNMASGEKWLVAQSSGTNNVGLKENLPPFYISGGDFWLVESIKSYANGSQIQVARAYRAGGILAQRAYVSSISTWSEWFGIDLSKNYLPTTGGTLTGNLVLSGATLQTVNGANSSVLNSTGLRFSNTVDNSATNTLSWYETGTYTPVLSGGTTTGTFTYSTQLGRYTRIGRMVYIDVNVTVTGASVAPAGNLWVSLPMTAISDANKLSQAAAITNNLTITGQAFVQTQSGSTNASVLVVNNGVSTAVSSSSDTTFTIQFSLAYVAA